MTSVIIFDGDCGICTASAQWLRGGFARAVRIVPSQDVSDLELAAMGLTRRKVQRSVAVCTPRFALTGALAVNAALWYAGRLRWLAAAAFVFPPLLLAEMLIYPIVAARRHRISSLLGLDACRITTPPSDVRS